MYDVVFEAAVAGIEEKLSQFGVEDAKQLAQRCAESFKEAKGLAQGSLEHTDDYTNTAKQDSPASTSGSSFAVFSMGDMWPPSILIDEEHISGPHPISLIDWEFSGPALPLQDIAQLGKACPSKASLRLNTLSHFLYDTLSTTQIRNTSYDA
jgi:thiamine kinase-like enzyme